MIQDAVQKLEKRFAELEGGATVIRLDYAFTAFTGDVIGTICCEEREQFLDDPEFAPHW